MIGAIKRRWKSKKAKVLHKGSELSTSSGDSCPTSRGGFTTIDVTEEFEKMAKPPSPRQVHPVLEKGDNIKYGHHQNNSVVNGGSNNGQQQQQHQSVPYHVMRKKSSTLPSSDDGGGCPFIRVNSGRIELVSSKDCSSTTTTATTRTTGTTGSGSSYWKSVVVGGGGGDGGGGSSGGEYDEVMDNSYATRTGYNNEGVQDGRRRPPQQQQNQYRRGRQDGQRHCGTRNNNDSRHSWCGSGVRDLQVTERKKNAVVLPVVGGYGDEEGIIGATLPVLKRNNKKNSRTNTSSSTSSSSSSSSSGRAVPSQQLSPSSSPHNHPPLPSGNRLATTPPSPPSTSPPPITTTTTTSQEKSTSIPGQAKVTSIMAVPRGGNTTNNSRNSDVKTVTTGGGGAATTTTKMSPLKERLAAIEEIATTIQNWQQAEKVEYERCVTDLASQVSRAVALQQLMKSEVEKLQQRVVDLENHNKAMATMIIPTLMKLHETVGPEVLESQSLLPSTAAAEVTQSRTEEGDVEEQEEEDEEKVIIERKSPKHTKIDCRIPRMSAGGQSQQRPTRSQGIIPKSQQQQQQMDDITNENKSDCREASPHGSLSPSRKSEHSSHNGGSNSKIITTSTTSTGSASSVKSSSFSGIPRMSSPRPTQHHHQRSSSQQAPSSKDRRNSPRNITSHDGGQVNSNSGNSSSSSRLPVFRKNVMSKSSPNSSSPNRRSSSNSQGRSGGSNSATKISSPSSISKTPSPSVSNRSSASPVATITSFSSSSSTESKSSKNVPATTTGKDEGYSTMSSEALAEQEKRDTGPILMMTKGRGSSSSNNGTGKLMHKSNTFNTFREMGDNNYWLATNSSNGGGGKGVRAVGRLVEPRNFTSLPPAAKAIVMASSTLATTVTTAANTPSPAGTPLKKGTVRIIRGMPYEIEHIGGEDNEPSASTILWEDSDDSDILFLPLEMSSGSSSRSTLIPPPPSSHSEGNFLTSSSNNKVTAAVRPIGGGANPVGFLTEDRALIEKWMRLEDVRNEVQWDDEWAWDWDGVQQAPGGVSSNIPLKSLRSIREAEADDDNEDGGNDDDDEFWLREKDLFLQTFPQSSLLTSHGEDGRLVEKAGEVVGVGGVGESDGSPAQIDSSTWTKTKCGKIKSKLLEDAGLCGDEFGIAKGGRSSNVASRGAAASEGEVENSQQQQRQPKQQLYVMGNGIVGKKIATTTSPHSFSSPSSSNTTTSPLKRTQNELRNEQQEGLLINEQCQSSSETMKNTTVATEPASLGEDGIPPVIEFTPEYYHLVNYGSNLSFSDNESSSSPQHSHEIRSSLGPNNNNNSSKCSRNAASSNNSKSSSKSSYNHQHHNSRMDDKVSQTDFEGESSQENISTSAELFSECRNCLEMIKKLVSSPSSEDPSCSATAAAILVQSNGGDGAAADFSSSDEQRTDAGCPTTWISVPKGLPTTEVDRILEILSSSESEDVLSPAK